MSNRSEKIKAQGGAFYQHPSQWWHRHIIGPSELEALFAAADAQGSTVDELISDIESRGLGWSMDRTGHAIEARVMDGPNVIGRYRTNATEPLTQLLAKAMFHADWTRYPVKTL